MNAPNLAPAALDLSLCAREPIHIPGAIQPHGALLAARCDSGLITHASANLGAILGMSAEAVLGRPLAQAVGAAAAQAMMDAGQRSGVDRGEHRIVAGNGAGHGPGHSGTLDLQSHQTGRHICVDIEPMRFEPWQQPTVSQAQTVLDSFKDATSQADLCDRAVRGLRRLTGYDRVMAYRFCPDGHGEVIAEIRAAGLTPYLGQHYPASDIPAQARRQYLTQRVGAIADSAYQPVALITDPLLDDATPLDLTRSALRSVSPVHRRYMRNMKTGASLTIGLAQGPSDARVLWGMLVCHHAVPRIAGPDLRAMAGMIGKVVTLLLGGMASADIHTRRNERNLTLRTMASRLAAPVPLIDTLAAMSGELLDLVDATGAVVRLAGETVCLGRTPALPAAEAALALLHPGPGGDVVALDDLGLRHPALAACAADGSGALLLPLAESADDAILWFRPEQTSTIIWGGNPANHATSDPLTGELTPRDSFDSWREVVRGHATPWQEGDLSLAQALRQVIEAELARRTRTALVLFDQVFQSSPTALVLTGLEGRISMVNRHAEQMFGYAPDELDGTPMDQLIPARFRRQYADHRARFLTAGQGGPTRLEAREAGLELFGLHKDGTEFPLEIGLCAIAPVDFVGEAMVQASIIDLTTRRGVEQEKRDLDDERQQKRRELEQSNADLEEFSYAVSHDLKAPLRAIGHLAQWIGEDIAATASPETLENIRLMQARVVRMQKLLEGLLEYSCLGRTDASVETVDIADVVRDIVAMLAPPPSFVVAFEGDAMAIRTERVAIQMVLENLISNGLKHHDRAEGRITVSMRRVDHALEIRVQDDGPGIAEPFQQRIFTIFQTLKSRDVVEGSGIGLAIAKRKVETHGGRIWVESAPPARGATFVFTWHEATS